MCVRMFSERVVNTSKVCYLDESQVEAKHAVHQIIGISTSWSWDLIARHLGQVLNCDAWYDGLAT